MKFTLIVEEDNSRITQEFTENNWFEVLDQLIKFLNAAGFSVPQDSIGINLSKGFLTESVDLSTKRFTVFEGN